MKSFVNRFLVSDGLRVATSLKKLVGILSLSSLITFSWHSQAAEKIPRLNGNPDFSGIWQTTSAAYYDLEPQSARVDAPPGPGVVEGG